MIYFPWSSADAAAMGLCLREKRSITNAFSFLPEANILPPFLQTRRFSNVFFVWRQDSKKSSKK